MCQNSSKFLVLPWYFKIQIYNLKHPLKIKWCPFECRNIVESNITRMSVLLFVRASIRLRSTVFMFVPPLWISRLRLKTFLFSLRKWNKAKTDQALKLKRLSTNWTQRNRWHGATDTSNLTLNIYIAFIFYISVVFSVLNSNFCNVHTFLCFVEEGWWCSLLAKRCGTVVVNRANHSGEYGIQPSQE